MNLILFELPETQRPLPIDDPRARHVLEVLRRRVGESFDAGLIDGPRGKATVEAIDERLACTCASSGARSRRRWSR